MKDTTIVLPGQIEPFTDTFMLALAIYREARGEDLTGKIAAGCVIRNRVQHPSWYGGNWFDVITKPYQFSSFNPGDRNSAVFGSAADRAWQNSIAAALRVMGGEPDPTRRRHLLFRPDSSQQSAQMGIDLCPHRRYRRIPLLQAKGELGGCN